MIPSTPTVSVVIPAYNAQRYLRQCLDSVVGQRLPQGQTLEVTVVDDGSTDSTAAIAESYGPAVTLVRQPNAGVSAARNAGVARSRGQWVTFVDADDALRPRALARMLRCAALDPSARLVLTGTRRAGAVTAEEAIEGTLHQTAPYDVSPWGKLIRRDVAVAQPFKEGTRYEDLEWFHRVAAEAESGGGAGSIRLMPEAAYRYRRHSGSFLHTFSPARLDVLEVTRGLVRRYAGTPLEDAAVARRFAANANVWLLLGRRPRAERPAWAEARSRCTAVLDAYCRRVMADPRARLKDRLGALAWWVMKSCGA